MSYPEPRYLSESGLAMSSSTPPRATLREWPVTALRSTG